LVTGSSQLALGSPTFRETLPDLDSVTTARIGEQMPNTPAASAREQPSQSVACLLPKMGEHPIRILAHQPLGFSHTPFSGGYPSESCKRATCLAPRQRVIEMPLSDISWFLGMTGSLAGVLELLDNSATRPSPVFYA
jgi:hypothetical protein